MLGGNSLMETLKYSNISFCVLSISLLHIQSWKGSLFLGVIQDTTVEIEELSTKNISSS